MDRRGVDGQTTAHRPRFAVLDERRTTFTLTVVEGSDIGKSFTLTGLQHGPVLVGTSEACEVRFDDREVSRRHVALDVHDRRLRIKDLESMNGTYVDGVALTAGFLMPGQLVRIGATAFRVESAPDPSVQSNTEARTQFGRMMGRSAVMQRLYPLLERIAGSTASVLVEGETGTGKEVLAEALHETGPRAQGPYVVFDCTAVPASLLEAELFGHERGAFTGAVASKKGVFEQADGGTLLIDEVGDLELTLQPKLLRAIERGEVRRIGGSKPFQVDVRILAATRRDLDHEVQVGRFRDDLYHRLVVGRVELPPLRDRKGDVPFLAQHFCKHLGGSPLSSDLLSRWEDYRWPGNVRELRNAVARVLLLGDLGATDLARAGAGSHVAAANGNLFEATLNLRLPLALARQRIVDAFERVYIARVLQEHDGNVERAAAASGIGRRYLQKLKARERGG